MSCPFPHTARFRDHAYCPLVPYPESLVTFFDRFSRAAVSTRERDIVLVEIAALLMLTAEPKAPPAPVVTRVRPLSGPARFVLDEGLLRSPTIVRLVEELHRHDVFVYVELDEPSDARGSTGIMSVAPGARFLRIRIHRRLDPRQQIEVLGHELHHALEIARAAEVVDDKSFRAFYDRIGYQNGRGFETDGAKRIEEEIRRDLSFTGRRSAQRPK